MKIWTGLSDPNVLNTEQADEDHRNRQHRFDDAADDVVGDAPDVAADEPEQRSDDHAQQGRERGDEQNVAGTRHDPGEHVTSELVGAERVRSGSAPGSAGSRSGAARTG